MTLFVVFAAADLHAGDLTLFGGVQKPEKLTLSNVGALITLNPATFGTYGLRYSQGRIFGSETTLSYSPNFISSQNKALIFNTNFILHLPFPLVRPYGTVGLGTVYIGGDTLRTVTGGKFAINYGGGAKIKLGGPVGVQFDVRNYQLSSVGVERLNVLETSVGIVFSF